MLTTSRNRSNSAISLHELDSQSHARASSSSTNWSSHLPSQSQRDSHSQDDSDHDPSEPRGAGTAVPPEGESGDEPETSSNTPKPGSRIAKFWVSHISCEVDMKTARDHLALERTFLGYLRTSMMMSILGTMIAQLFNITHHDAGFGYTLIGKPLAMTCFAFSIGTILLGAVRSWRHQDHMKSGRALSGGFEIHLIGIGTFLLVMVFFGFLVAIDVVKVEASEAAGT
ncbi:hypothetical protein B0T10DRAFT_132155 [Thelonectria olida]|uniref:DUF202 domain-containing protein n=1 Tax=Thelonectria olida TaxID=1576542 RepID=A0A9P9ALF2_9HYPO|nr:hypothetical protein B0T10DRAFT_132155 [Thelonectria olida]